MSDFLFVFAWLVLQVVLWKELDKFLLVSAALTKINGRYWQSIDSLVGLCILGIGFSTWLLFHRVNL